MREFDLTTKGFVTAGFKLPEGKHVMVDWVDNDTLLVASPLGENAATTSGYPLIVRRWRRGERFETAQIVFEGKPFDVGVWGFCSRIVETFKNVFVRKCDFDNLDVVLEDNTGRRIRLDVPSDSDAACFRDWLVIQTRSDWEIGDRLHPAGSLLVTRLSAFLIGARDIAVLFAPSERRILESVRHTADSIAFKVLDNVRPQLFIARHGSGGWSVDPVAGFHTTATLDIGAFDDLGCASLADGEQPADDYLIVSNDAVTAPTLWLLRGREAPRILKQQPAGFDTTGLTITQHEAISIDGVRILYFQVARKDLPRDGSTAFLVTGYGGYQMCELPTYRISDGKLWLERGGAWVIANIRGGGEFGPAWHKAGQREGIILAHDDFAAVAKDLIARNVTRAARLACYGASHGGLLVGNMMTRYPELFGAIIADAPQLDMLRFTQLGAGRGWVSEYGDPDRPEDWTYLRKLSAYHNVSPDTRYPPMFLITATNDDRVHPGHARKLAARLIEQGHTVYFDEAGDGGHGSSVNTQEARKMALLYAFLRKTIAPEMT